jgi:DNA-binding CsgD family transcriptional regulator
LRLRLILTFAVLLCIGVALSLFLSDKYDRPLKELMNALKSGDMSAKSNIQEIDDLVEFMRARLKETGSEEDVIKENSPPENAEAGNLYKSAEYPAEDSLDDFVENTKKLSRAEADVFNLYLEGHNALKIAEILNLSINTVKSHNRRIFTKLNVSSVKELQTWIRLLSSMGHSFDESQQKQFEKIKNKIKKINDTASGSVE